MKGNIDGVRAGIYYSQDDDLLCKISKSDNGVQFEIADFQGQFFYAVTIDEHGKANFEIGVLPQELNEEERMDDDED
jgi:hypothetical protein